MNTTRQTLMILVLTSIAVLSLLTGCKNNAYAISTAVKMDKKVGIDAPGIEEIKAIAEEGFIYGLPIVMNYAVMNEFCIDKNSGQYSLKLKS